MNTHDSSPTPDPERLLRARLRDTTPEFERRWVDLKRDLRSERTPARQRWLSLAWLGMAAAAGIFAVALLLFLDPAPPEMAQLAPSEIAAFGDLVALDDALRDAFPLLDAETREALINLPDEIGI